MSPMQRWSEPYQPTGGMAAVGVLNQLGRPDIEPLEVLVREAIQNCWDAKRQGEKGISVSIARRKLDAETVRFLSDEVLPDPPLGLPLADCLGSDLRMLHFADFGTNGLTGPTRADLPSIDDAPRDFVDFVRNIGQPPDREFGGGSYGYGKAAHYIASEARTILIDTLCESTEGFERRFIACAIGDYYNDEAGRPFTGRHWWGTVENNVPEPLLNSEAEKIAETLGLPDRTGRSGLGTTIAVIAPSSELLSEVTDNDAMMAFIAEALVWNFWPRTTGSTAAKATMKFDLSDDGERVSLPNPKTHPRLRGFVEAMDRIRLEPEQTDDPFLIDQEISCQRPIQRLGRLVIQRGTVGELPPATRPEPEGARATRAGVHHIALMRNAELVVKYMRGPEPIIERAGYSGVFRCALDIDQVFRRAEPPTHDDWIVRALVNRRERTFVKVALDRIREAARSAAGLGTGAGTIDGGAEIPLGEFADHLAMLMPGLDGPGARRPASMGKGAKRRSKRKANSAEAADEPWVEGSSGDAGPTPPPDSDGADGDRAPDEPKRPPPAVRSGGPPLPVVFEGGSPVMAYPFQLRANGGSVRLSATVEVMTNDGGQVEREAPVGFTPPDPVAWIAPSGETLRSAMVEMAPEDTDGSWTVMVPIVDDLMMRVDVKPEAL